MGLLMSFINGTPETPWLVNFVWSHQNRTISNLWESTKFIKISSLSLCFRYILNSSETVIPSSVPNLMNEIHPFPLTIMWLRQESWSDTLHPSGLWRLCRGQEPHKYYSKTLFGLIILNLSVTVQNRPTISNPWTGEV